MRDKKMILNVLVREIGWSPYTIKKLIYTFLIKSTSLILCSFLNLQLSYYLDKE